MSHRYKLVTRTPRSHTSSGTKGKQRETMKSVRRKLFPKRNKQVKPGKESDPPSTPRLEELPSPVASSTVSSSGQSGMWCTARRDYRMQPYVYQHGLSARPIPHQPTSEESRLKGENNELRKQLQQKCHEYAREADLTRQLRQKNGELQDGILSSQKRYIEIKNSAAHLIRESELLRCKLQEEQKVVVDETQKLLQSGRYIIQLEHDKRHLQNDIDEATSQINALKEELRDKDHRLDSAKNEITERETELRRVREELDEERNNKMAPRHNQGEEIDEKLSRLQSETAILDQQLQEAARQLGLKDKTNQQMDEALRQKDDEIAQMKHELNATASQLQSETAILDQKLQEATRELELKDKNNQQMEEALRQKHDEIAQMKHELYTTKQSLERESERVSKTEHELRQWGEEKDKEAKLAFNDISSITQEIQVLQNELSARDEHMRNSTKQTELILQQKDRDFHDLKAAFETEYQQLQSRAEAERETLKTEYHFLKADRDALETERNSLETKVDSLRAERDSLQRQYTEVKAVAEDLQYRLSKEFSIRLASDETNMENISVKHRPAKIAEKFAQIESKEWVEAKEFLDDTRGVEKTSIRLLLDILQFACECAREVFDGFLSSEACRLYSPIAAITKTFLAEQYQNAGGSPQVPGSILKEITAFLKGTCGDCDIEALTQSVVNRLKEMHGEDIVPILQGINVKAFLQACCRIAWQMAVQQPPLTVVTSNTRYDEGCHQLWYSSPPPSRSKGVSRGEIDFYIWPELRQAENVLHRGRVCLKPSE